MTVPIVVDTLRGDLTVPTDAVGVVAFARWSGSSRHSPRNIAVAWTLQDNSWLPCCSTCSIRARSPSCGSTSKFGASTGAAAALRAAAERPA